MAKGGLPGGLAPRTFLALASGVALWFVMAGFFPTLTSLTRGPMG